MASNVYTIKRNEKRPIKKERLSYNAPPTLGYQKPGNSRFIISKIIRTTEKAQCLLIKGKEVWLPKRIIKIGLHPERTVQMVEMPTWFAKTKNLYDPYAC